jgi:hypothetical protein
VGEAVNRQSEAGSKWPVPEHRGGEIMDNVLRNFLQEQYREGMALADESDLLDLIPVEGSPPDRYIARYFCKGLIRSSGEVREAENFVVGIWLPSDYLKRVEPLEIVSWLAPENVFHPNIGRGPGRDYGPLAICLGRIGVGTPLVDILYQTWEVITYAKATMSETDALNWDACRWSRWNTYRFPVDRRPLKRSIVDLDVKEIKRASSGMT